MLSMECSKRIGTMQFERGRGFSTITYQDQNAAAVPGVLMFVNTQIPISLRDFPNPDSHHVTIPPIWLPLAVRMGVQPVFNVVTEER